MGLSILFFGIPALLMALAFYWLMPLFISQGLNDYYAYMLSMGLPLFSMLASSLAAYRLEGNPWTWKAFNARMRLHKIKWVHLAWLVGLFLGAMLLNTYLAQFENWLIGKIGIPLPQNLPPLVDPRGTQMTIESIEATTGGLEGNWLALSVFVVTLAVNVIGEELWWRGIILPRQELVFGKWTWLVHGLMWNFFHLYKWWDLIGILPMALGLSYLVWKTRNNSAGILWHFISNGAGVFPLLLRVLKLG
jgi:membrane protease YdiL (CAAX protease family)